MSSACGHIEMKTRQVGKREEMEDVNLLVFMLKKIGEKHDKEVIHFL